MGEFLPFLAEHWILSTAFVVLSAMLVWSFIAPAVRGFAELPPAEAIKLINRDDAVVVDVRSENEFLDGHIINAINVPLTYLAKRLDELEKYKQSSVIIVCQSGARSKQACVQLKQAGFEKVSSLAGGLMAWQHDKLPLHKKK